MTRKRVLDRCLNFFIFSHVQSKRSSNDEPPGGIERSKFRKMESYDATKYSDGDETKGEGSRPEAMVTTETKTESSLPGSAEGNKERPQQENLSNAKESIQKGLGYVAEEPTDKPQPMETDNSLKLVPCDAEFDYVDVEFHVLLSPDFQFEPDEHCIWIAFGPPLSDWTCANVQMELSSASAYAAKQELRYFSGKLRLSRDLVGKKIPYKYVHHRRNGEDRWEFIYHEDCNYEDNRCLEVKGDVRTFGKFDDVICERPGEFWVKHNTVPLRARQNKVNEFRSHATSTILSTITAKFVENRGVVTATRLILDIFQSHGPNGIELLKHNKSKAFLNAAGYSTTEQKRLHLRRLETAFARQVQSSKSVKGGVTAAFFICTISKATDTTVKDASVLVQIFQTFKDGIEFLLPGAGLDELLPNAEDRQEVAQAIHNAVLKYFYFLETGNDNRHVHENGGVWIYSIPILIKLGCNSRMMKALKDRHQEIASRSCEQPYLIKELPEVSCLFPHASGLSDFFLGTLIYRDMIELVSSDDFSSYLPLFDVGRVVQSLVDFSHDGFPANCFPDEEQHLLRKEAEGRKRILSLIEEILGSASQETQKNILKSLLDAIGQIRRRSGLPELLLFVMRIVVTLTQVEGCTPTLEDLFLDLVSTLTRGFNRRPPHEVLKHWIGLLELSEEIEKASEKVKDAFQSYLQSLRPEECLDLYLCHGHCVSAWPSDQLFNQALKAFQNSGKSSFFQAAVTRIKDTLGLGSAQVNNSAKLVDRALCNRYDLTMTTQDFGETLLNSDYLTNLFKIVELHGEAFNKDCPNLKVTYRLLVRFSQWFQTDEVPIDFMRKCKFSSWRRVESAFKIASDHFGGDCLVIPDCAAAQAKKKVADSFLRDAATVGEFDDFLMTEYEKLHCPEWTEMVQRAKSATLIEVMDQKVFPLSKEDISLIEWVLRCKTESILVAQVTHEMLVEELGERVTDKTGEANEVECDLELLDALERLSGAEPTSVQRTLQRLRRIKERCESLLDELLSGTIYIREVQHWFTKMDETKVTSELNLLKEIRRRSSMDGPFRDEMPTTDLKELIQTLSKAEFYDAAAETIDEVCHTLKITPTFRFLESLKEVSRNVLRTKDVELKSLSNIRDGGKAVGSWRREELECIGTIARSGKIISWVKENINSLQELKVFVDLASINAGESDIDVGRVLCFQSAVSGYAPLIFDLKKNCTEKKFLTSCSKVIKKFNSDRKLPVYLRDSNNQYAWIKEVNDRHGSVEASSLSVVQQINENGIFRLKSPLTCLMKRKTPTVSDIITLSYASISDGESDRLMSLEELQELHSKLMLFSTGKSGQLAVQRFANVLNIVVTVAELLVKLLNAGCTRFASLKPTCYMDENKKVSVLVECEASVFRGKKPVMEQLQDIAKFLDDWLVKWNVYVKNEREKRPSLNYYTTEQLVNLSRAFGRNDFGTEDIMLLRFSCPEVDLKEVHDAISSLPRMSDEQELNFKEEVPPISLSNETNKTPDRRSQVVNELIDTYSFPKEVALAAVLAHEPDLTDVEKLAEWCVDHEDETELIDSFVSGERDGTSAMDVVDDDQTDPNPTNDASTSQFVEQSWSDFMKNSTHGPDAACVSLDQLAVYIEILVKRFGKRPDRHMPMYLQPGRPNLIICPAKDLHAVATSIYQADEDKSLPGLDEVLVCTPQTTAESVELVCRRAFSDNTGKIFTVLNAHRLNIGTSMLIEDLLTTRPENAQYRLCFVCSKEASGTSSVVTALDRHSVALPATPDWTALSSYLKKHLSARAIQADPEGCCFRVVTSDICGNGKTLFIDRIAEKESVGERITVQVQDNTSVNDVIQTWNEAYNNNSSGHSMYHMDFVSTYSNLDDRNDILFGLAVLKGLQGDTGCVWCCSEKDFYVAEMTVSLHPRQDESSKVLWEILPRIDCCSPTESAEILKSNQGNFSGLVRTERGIVHTMDWKEYMSEKCQRPYQYLSLHARDKRALETFTYSSKKDESHMLKCLLTLMKYCPIEDPTWRELSYFTSFLNVQLMTSERSIFCNANIVGEDLPGFKTFVVRFLVIMSQDFASRSVEISDQSQGEGFCKPVIQERRRWENSPHPYIFFNEDGQTISFFGLHIQNYYLVAEKTRELLEAEPIMTPALYEGLRAQGVRLNIGFDSLKRQEKLEQLCRVMGVSRHDPDPSYELTYDNVMKMLAIHMRFRAGIPVVVMGETGSGKTRLIKFLCGLRNGAGEQDCMTVLKMHGGVTATDIVNRVQRVLGDDDRRTRRGQRSSPQKVIFFDEANTTNAIGTIKSIMCDRTLGKSQIPPEWGYHFVAAVNPYRTHSEEMIRKLENAGLGFHVEASKTTDRIGKIPMRHLVYRVREIPASMFPLIFDFGILDADTEEKYISQMIQHRVDTGELVFTHSFKQSVLLECLSRSQTFMRKQDDECSFVSLRDVERTLDILTWFETKKGHIYGDLYKNLCPRHVMADSVTSLVLALGASYYVRLDDRDPYNRLMSNLLQRYDWRLIPRNLTFSDIVEACQNLFINEMQLENNIAKNKALKENLWIMTICIDLKIPLFLVGKPGSSKSLAKTVLADAMQGSQSYSKLFQQFKEIHMVSFQCSQLATASGIHATFAQCQKFQEKRDLSTFAAVVVLDEVGLAEDSPKMPLKALHPLLEDGCLGDETPSPHLKTAFVGISNWALDPAKMNRGILVARGVPSIDDLMKSATEICANHTAGTTYMKKAIRMLTEGYSHVCKKQGREYFGLRDFYSVVKMVLAIVVETEREPAREELVRAVQRNFGGYFGDFDPAVEFLKKIRLDVEDEELVPPKELILDAIVNEKSGLRYILLLTKNNAALRIIEEQNLIDTSKTLMIYGSSFPLDQEYTHICSNINRIKIAMEVGQTVLLSNLCNLYESLYDALNQNYVMLGGKRYVDLGLGTHRVKCRVHENFRLIVVAEDTEVFRNFPVPLINRMEKHFLGMETMVSSEVMPAVAELKEWAQRLSEVKFRLHSSRSFQQFQPGDVIMGYHSDIAASLLLRLVSDGQEDLVTAAKMTLLQCVTPDAMIRLAETSLSHQDQHNLRTAYYVEQRHESLTDFLKSVPPKFELVQVTTNSRLLSKSAKESIAQELEVDEDEVTILSLLQFDTEEQFGKQVSSFVQASKGKLLIVQTEVQTKIQQNLVECARHVVRDRIRKSCRAKQFLVVFVLHIPRVVGGYFKGLSAYPWFCGHVDELRKSQELTFSIPHLNGKTIVAAFEENHVDLCGLIMSCLPKAISASATKGFNSARLQWRIEKLLQHLEDPTCQFMRCIRKVLIEGLKSQSYQPESWLVNLAMNSHHLKEGNTFRKSIWLHLCEVVSPLLAAVISFSDADDGLNLLFDGAERDLQDMFVEVMSSTKIAEMRDFLNTVDKQFRARFPLSRFIFAFRLSQVGKRNLRSETSEATQRAVLENHPICNLARSCFERGFTVLRRYIHDVSHILFPEVKDPETREFVCFKIFQASKLSMAERNRNDGSYEYVTPADVVWGVHLLQKRLIILVDVCNSWSKLPPVLESLESKLPNYGNGVFLSDILAVQTVVTMYETLLSRGFDKEVTSKEWCLGVEKVRVFHRRLMALKFSDGDLKMKMAELEHSIRRLTIIKMFLTTVCDAGAKKKVTRVACSKIKRLMIALKKNTFKCAKELKKLIDWLVLTNEAVSKYHFLHGQDTCVLCLEDLRSPVTLPCKHVGCADCFNYLFDEESKGHWKCPKEGCSQGVPENWSLEAAEASQEAVSLHYQFKNRLNMFFLAVLRDVAFEGSDPDDEVVDMLLSFVVTKQLPKDQRAPRTKSASPFAGHRIDPNPVIRSFILQLLLRSDSMDYAKRSLNKYLEEERKLASQGKARVELYVLVSHCLEDWLVKRYSGDDGITMRVAYEFLSGVRQLDGKFSPPGEVLENLSKARLSLHTLAKCLHNCLEGQNEGDQDVLKFLTAMEKLVQESPAAEELKKFLARCLVQTYRRDIIRQWKETGKFVQLLPTSLRTAALCARQDPYLVLGVEYHNIKNNLRKVLTEGTFEDFEKQLKHSQMKEFKLAIYYLVLAHPDLAEPGRDLAMTVLAKGDRIALNAIDTIMEEQRLGRRKSGIREAIATLTHHLSVVLRERPRDPLALLATIPKKASLIPTMPQDDAPEVTRATRDVTRWYKCSKGHVYAVGDCGQLKGTGRCPDCSDTVGLGGQAQPASPMTEDRTQEGHILGRAKPTDVAPGVRRLCASDVAVIRYT